MATPAANVPCSTATTKLDDHKAIEAVVEKYIAGSRRGDSSVIKPAFHDNAQMYGMTPRGMTPGPIQALYDYVDSSGPVPDIEYRIASITISDGCAASVVLHADHWLGLNYTDHFHLLKVDAEWKIFSKIFSHN